MGEIKREDASLGSRDADGGETLAEPMEEVVEGNNGEDIMVEVLGSDVFVDGVRSHEGGGDTVGDVSHGTRHVVEAKSEAEVDGKLRESGVPVVDLGVQSSEREGIVSSESLDTVGKVVESSEVVARIRVDETEKEVVVVGDTQLLDEEKQPVEKGLVDVVAEKNNTDVLKDPMAEKGVQDSVEAGKEKDEQSADKSVGPVVLETAETAIPDEEKSRIKNLHGENGLKTEDSETHSNDVPEVGGEKVSAVENVSSKGETEDKVAAATADSIEETPPVAVEGGIETIAGKLSPGPELVTTDAGVPDATLNSAEDQRVNGGSTEAAAVPSDAEVVDGNSADGAEVVDSNVPQEMEAEQRTIVDADMAPSDGNKNAAEAELLQVESMTRLTESIATVTEVAETVEKTSDLDAEAPVSSNVEETLTVDMVCHGTQIDVEMADANEGIPGSSFEVSEPAENEKKTVDESSDVEDKETVTDAEMANLHEGDGTETDEEKSIKRSGAPKFEVRAIYQLPHEKEGKRKFSVSDLVWGKVRSHPWWPGQIFDPSDASEKAAKYHKKDSFLVAYFGDRTFAWNEGHVLKHFRTHFAIAEKQGSSQLFQNAVDCALEEVTRRVELGLACSCTPKEAIEKIEFQVVENTGIREESSKRVGAGEFSKGNCFMPEKLVEYMKELAQFPCDGAYRLDLVIAKAQLLSFYRLKGYSSLPEIVLTDGFSDEAENSLHKEENRFLGEAADAAGSVSAEEEEEEEEEDEDSGQEGSEPQKRSSLKRKHNLRESTYPFKKGRSITELMESTTEEDKRKSISGAKVTGTAPSPATVPKPSFKVGECIKRIASQLTGSPIVRSKSESDPSQSIEEAEKGAGVASEYSSMEDLLSQLQLAAQEPMQEHSFSSVIACFFSDFRNSVVLHQNPELVKSGSVWKRRRLAPLDGSSEAFEFDDMNDSYWTDRIIDNGGDEDPHSDGGTRVENQLVPIDSGKPHKTGRRPYTKRRLQETSNELPSQKPPGYIDANAPAELVMMFPEFGNLPSEADLSRMFKRFGPIRELETEVDREASRARVVFKKCSDAEVACSSAGRFNIFGPIHVTYQLNYSVSDMFRSSALAMMEVHEEDGL